MTKAARNPVSGPERGLVYRAVRILVLLFLGMVVFFVGGIAGTWGAWGRTAALFGYLGFILLVMAIVFWWNWLKFRRQGKRMNRNG